MNIYFKAETILLFIVIRPVIAILFRQKLLNEEQTPSLVVVKAISFTVVLEELELGNIQHPGLRNIPQQYIYI